MIVPYFEKMVKRVYLPISHVTGIRKQGRTVCSLVDSWVQISYIETVLGEWLVLQLLSFGVCGFVDFVCWVVGRVVQKR